MPRGQPSPPKLKIVKTKELPSTLVFTRTLYRPSPYVQKLQELSATPDAVLAIGDTTTQIMSVRKAAEKLGFDLLFSRNNGDVLVKIVSLSESQRRLLLLLREPRTLNDLRGASLELDIATELKDLAEAGTASLDKQGRWKLTPEGVARLAAKQKA